jgi:hypothetical protein
MARIRPVALLALARPTSLASPPGTGRLKSIAPSFLDVHRPLMTLSPRSSETQPSGRNRRIDAFCPCCRQAPTTSAWALA